MNFADDMNRVIRYGLWNHSDFQEKLHEDDADKMPALTYADWLEENGKPTAAAIIRSHVAENQYTTHDAADGNAPHPEPGNFRLVALHMDGPTVPPSFVMTTRSVARPGRTLMWLHRPKSHEDAVAMLRSFRDEGGFLSEPTAEFLAKHEGK